MEITLPSAAWQHHGRPAPQGLSPHSPAPCPRLPAQHRLSPHKTSPRPSLVAPRCPWVLLKQPGAGRTAFLHPVLSCTLTDSGTRGFSQPGTKPGAGLRLFPGVSAGQGMGGEGEDPKQDPVRCHRAPYMQRALGQHRGRSPAARGESILHSARACPVPAQSRAGINPVQSPELPAGCSLPTGTSRKSRLKAKVRPALHASLPLA